MNITNIVWNKAVMLLKYIYIPPKKDQNKYKQQQTKTNKQTRADGV